MTERERLASFPWFAGLDHALRSALLDTGRFRSLTRGEWLYGEGDDTTGLAAVLSGWLYLHAAGPGDRGVIFAAVGIGAVIGQSAALGGGARLLTAICAQEGRVFVLPDHVLTGLARQHPTLLPALLRLIYSHVGELIRVVTGFLTVSPRQRMIAQLLAMARYGSVVPMSQTTLAEIAGAKRNAVHRWLSELEQKGAVEREYGAIRICNPRLLHNELQADD